VFADCKKNPCWNADEALYVSVTPVAVRVRLLVVTGDGAVAGNPLKGTTAPVVFTPAFEYVAVRLIRPEPVDPLVATLWMGATKDAEVHAVELFTSVVVVVPLRIFLMVPLL
jgi:hypothetical protein